ncbi:Outer membrane protein OmpA [Robiginitalea myxolifaciens]|uniref:Outer membrane protein OmpA n=1 Tax=Robiginitalea myxolifaciens TaxID=400055 RepID=A0A1I6H259_9FLAO|nr:OmpA family protein [Robiginitalea myxolifaciens]SFR48492.1 Outer membrane protein OmpA [Robiginitalea myxolifaciens]
MKLITYALAGLIGLSSLQIATAQTNEITSESEIPTLTAKDSIVLESWIFGLGFNAVDDSGDGFNNLLSIEDKWNIVPFPSRVSIGRYFQSGLGLELIGSYNRYMEGNIVEKQVVTEEIPYWAIDSRLSYDLNKLVGETSFFDPYLGVGIGYADASNVGRVTFNGTVGFRLWFSKKWGVDLNSTGKWDASEETTNHIQHAAGVVRRFGIVEGLSKKGEEKLALIREMEEALQRRQDSIAEAERLAQAERMRLEEERLRQQREAELAAAEAARQAEAKRRADLAAELAGLGQVRFALNSSYLNTESKEVLGRVVDFMNRNNTLKFTLTAHADSRGNADYNLWLSQRRAEKTLSYLIGAGIDESRLSAEGKGESELLNHCSDGVRCTAAEHAVNRRSEITISAYE